MRVKFGLKIPNRLGKMSENFRGGGNFDSHCICRLDYCNSLLAGVAKVYHQWVWNDLHGMITRPQSHTQRRFLKPFTGYRRLTE